MSRIGSIRAFLVAATSAALLGGCTGAQSVMAPQSQQAEDIMTLWMVLLIGGTAIMLMVILLCAAALLGGQRVRGFLGRETLVIGGGIVFPAVTLTALLLYGFLVMRTDASASADDPLRIGVIGEQWWWRVVYTGPDGRRFESANEIRVPVGRRVELSLAAADVIHSLWVPNVAGKLDMIPGRINTLSFTVDRAGTSRGQCAEYCGGAHAMMALYLVAMEPGEFEAWMAKEAGPAEVPESPDEAAGSLLLQSSGCGGCHAIRGTEATGSIGPDLTHVGSRLSLGAGILPNDEAAFSTWIAENQHVKPENKMPSFGIFSGTELSRLSQYLAGLE
jgi:cytochrome c oxidase subunit 2